MYTMAMIDSGWKLAGIFGLADMAMMVMLMVGLVVGFWTGLIWQILFLVSLVASLFVSYVYHPTVADFLGAEPGDSVRIIGSAVGVFLASLLACYLVTFLFRGLINALKPQLADRIMGAAFGAVSGALVVGVVSFFVLQYADMDGRARSYVEKSVGPNAMAVVVRAFVYVLPDDMRSNELSAPAYTEANGTVLPAGRTRDAS